MTDAGPDHDTGPSAAANWFVRLHLPLTSAFIAAAVLSRSVVFADGVYLLVWGGTIVALLLRARRQGDDDGQPWRLAALGTVVAGLTMVVEQAARYTGAVDALRTVLDIGYLGGFMVIGLGVRQLVRRRAPHNDREGMIDGAIVAITMATVFGQLLTAAPMPDVDPASLSPSASFVMSLVAGVAIALSMRLVFLDPRVRAAWLLLAAATVSLVWSAGALLVVQAGASTLRTQYLVVLMMVAVLLLGRAALHPSAADLTRPVAATPWSLPRARLVLLGVALTVAPVRLVLHGVGHHRMAWLDVAPLVLTVLVLVQIGALVTERERTRRVARHRERQQAGVARLGVLAVGDLELSELLARSTEVVQRTLGVETAQITLTDEDATTTVCPDGARPVPVDSASVLDDHRLLWFGREGLQPLRSASQSVSCGGSAAIGTPIRGRDRASGVLLAFPGRLRRFTRNDLDFLTSVSAVLAGAIERERAEERLRYLAMYDPLTTLPNRTLFLDRLGQALAQQDRTEGRLGVLFADLDGFKGVNDTLGHDAGDELLQQVADRIRGCVREGETGRLAGDEFVVLVTGLSDAAAIHAVAERIVGRLDVPFELEAGPATIGASVGVVLADGDDDPESLLQRADQAMYRAKHAGKGRVAVAA